MKLTNVPPKWLKNPALRGPKVEVIRSPDLSVPRPAASLNPPAPVGETSAPATEPADELSKFDRARHLRLTELAADAGQVGTESGRKQFFARLGEVIDIETKQDRIDPAGRAAREKQRNAALQRMQPAFQRAFPDEAAAAAFVGELFRWLGDQIAREAQAAR
jgi:hypothetical protein